MNAKLIASTILICATFMTGTVFADEQACYSKGDYTHCKLRHANKLHVRLKEEFSRNKCDYGTGWATDSHGIWVAYGCQAMFQYGNIATGKHPDYDEPYSRHERRSGTCDSRTKGSECEYYKDGYKAGKDDGKASMSRFYGRHSDSYDSRFEPFFADGYKDGWHDYR